MNRTEGWRNRAKKEENADGTVDGQLFCRVKCVYMLGASGDTETRTPRDSQPRIT